jgi:hypothetical protein
MLGTGPRSGITDIRNTQAWRKVGDRLPSPLKDGLHSPS